MIKTSLARVLKPSILLLFATVFLSSLFVLLSPAYAAPQSKDEYLQGACGFYKNPTANGNGNGTALPAGAYDACAKGFNAALKNNAPAPKTTSPYGPCYTDSNLYKDKTELAQICQVGYANAYKNRGDIKKSPNETPEPSKAEKLKQESLEKCTPIVPSAANTDQIINACSDGYIAAVDSKKSVCEEKQGIYLEYCVKGYELKGGEDSYSGKSSENTGVEGDQCETKFSNPLTWAICPIADGITEMVNLLDSAINDLLNIDTNNIFNISNEDSSGFRYHQAWAAFRNIALGLIVIAALIVIIASALGFELLDAYTIRKVLPRIIIALLFITLSWSVLEFLVNITNDIGNGVRALIYAPFSDFHTAQLQNGALAVGTALLGAGIVFLGVIGLLSFGVTALIAALIAFLVLVIRELIVIFLIIIAPIGIAMMVLPNTQKAWRLWHSTLTNMLIVFPIIAGMIAIGRVFSVVTYNTQSSEPNFINQIIAFIAYYLPYFLIPFAFRLAGGMIGTLAGLSNDRTRGAFDRLSNFRKGRSAENWQKTKNFSRFSERTPLGRGINTMMGATANPKSMLRGRRGIADTRKALSSSYGAGILKDNQIWNDNQGDDTFLLAVADRELATTKMKKEIAKSQDMTDRSAAGDRKRAAAAMNADKYQHALSLASQMGQTAQSRGVQSQALSALAKTGFQFDDGEEGYNQLSTTARKIAGNNDGVYASIMNEAQYGLRTAGRYDLGGINNGAGYDAKAGTDKASLYELANAKPQSIDAMLQAVDSLPAAERTQGRAVLYKELEAMKSNAKGATRDKIVEVMGTLESTGLRSYMMRNSGQTESFRQEYNPRVHATDPSWTAGERARGWRVQDRELTNEQLAQKQARSYERPDPDRLST